MRKTGSNYVFGSAVLGIFRLVKRDYLERNTVEEVVLARFIIYELISVGKILNVVI